MSNENGIPKEERGKKKEDGKNTRKKSERNFVSTDPHIVYCMEKGEKSRERDREKERREEKKIDLQTTLSSHESSIALPGKSGFSDRHVKSWPSMEEVGMSRSLDTEVLLDRES